MRILCYGDSNTWGYHPGDGCRYGRNSRWPAVLAQLTAQMGWEVVEEGLNGRTTIFYAEDEHYRCGLDYIEPCVLSHVPLDVIAVMLGTNDTKWKYRATAQEITEGMKRVIAQMRTCCARKEQYPQILLISPPPLLMVGENEEFDKASEKKAGELPVLYEVLAKQTGCLFLRASKAVSEIGADGVHMTAEGHRQLARAVCDLLTADETI